MNPTFSNEHNINNKVNNFNKKCRTINKDYFYTDLSEHKRKSNLAMFLKGFDYCRSVELDVKEYNMMILLENTKIDQRLVFN